MGHIEHEAKTRTEKLIDALNADTDAVRSARAATADLEREVRWLRQQIENGKVSPIEAL